MYRSIYIGTGLFWDAGATTAEECKNSCKSIEEVLPPEGAPVKCKAFSFDNGAENEFKRCSLMFGDVEAVQQIDGVVSEFVDCPWTIDDQIKQNYFKKIFIKLQNLKFKIFCEKILGSFLLCLI